MDFKNINSKRSHCLFLILTIFGFWIKSSRWHDMGVEGIDSIFYLKIVQQWLQGNFVFTVPENGAFFRPVLYSYFALPSLIFGLNSWSIFIFNIFTEMIIFIYLFKLAKIYIRNEVLIFSLPLLYLFSYFIIPQTTTILAHIPSILFIVIAFFHVANFIHKSNAIKDLIVSALSLHCAFSVHPDLALFAPGMVFYFVFSKKNPLQKDILISSIKESALYTFFFFAPFIIYLGIWGTDTILATLKGQSEFPKTVPGKHFPMLVIEFLSIALKKLIGSPFTQLFYLSVVYLIYKSIKDKIFSRNFLILLPVFSYMILFELLITRNVLSPLVRLLMPAIPIIYLFILCAIDQAISKGQSKNKINIFVITVLLLALLYPFYRNRDRGISFAYYNMDSSKAFWEYKTKYQWVFDKLKDQTSENKKVLFAPSSFYYRYQAYNLPFYFNGNGVHLSQCKSGNSLDNFLNTEKISWLYIAPKHHLRKKRLKNKSKSYCTVNAPYYTSQEIKVLRNFIKQNNLKPYIKDEYFGEIYKVR